MDADDQGHRHHGDSRPALDRFRVGPGAPVRLRDADAATTAGAPGGRPETEAAFAQLHDRLRGLQDRLWAEARRSLLVVLQGIDAAGKDGTVGHVFAGLNPLGTRVAVFKVPNAEELAHDYLWRVHRRCPARGEIGIFNRSHYEDVLVTRVHGQIERHTWEARYGQIRAFEAMLRDEGTTMVKLFLHISRAEQEARLAERLADPTKRWKASPADFAERERWDDYRVAFEEMLGATSTTHSPWYVIPADHKWYRNWAVSNVLIETLEGMDPQYPAGPLSGDTSGSGPDGQSGVPSGPLPETPVKPPQREARPGSS